MNKTARFLFFTMILVSLFVFVSWKKEDADYRSLIEKGDFQKAECAIREVMEKDPSLTAEDKIQLGFEIDRMHRIRLNFSKTENDILEYVKTYIPEATIADLKNGKTTVRSNSWSSMGKRCTSIMPPQIFSASTRTPRRSKSRLQRPRQKRRGSGPP